MSLEYPGDSQYPILRSFRMIYNDNRTSLSPKEGINKKRKKTQENACMEEKENRWFVGPSSRSGFPRNTWSTTLSENCIGKLPTCQPDQLLGSDKANTTTSVIRRDNLFVTCFRICITACDTQPKLLLLAILLFRYHLHLHIHHAVYNVRTTKSFPLRCSMQTLESCIGPLLWRLLPRLTAASRSSGTKLYLVTGSRPVVIPPTYPRTIFQVTDPGTTSVHSILAV